MMGGREVPASEQSRAVSQASMAAARLHARLHLDLSRPVDVFRVVENLGIWLTTQPLGNLFGFYLRQDQSLGICLNAGHPETLQRYTCAHELAHHVLGHDSNLDNGEDIDSWSGATPIQERAAQVFAGNFLMPLGLVNRVLRRLDLFDKTLSASDVYLVSRELDVSFSAAVWRLRSLNRLTGSAAAAFVGEGAAAAKAALRAAPLVTSARSDLWVVSQPTGELRLACRTGDEILLRLPENRSTGRVWRYRASDSSITPSGPDLELSWDGATGIEGAHSVAMQQWVSAPGLRVADDRHIEAPLSASLSVENPHQLQINGGEMVESDETWLREALGVEGVREIALVADAEGDQSLMLELKPGWDSNLEALASLLLSVRVHPAHALDGFATRQALAHLARLAA
jgi:Zn-dependent peptidase ImmA (M78 family)/predicted secreted protein